MKRAIVIPALLLALVLTAPAVSASEASLRAELDEFSQTVEDAVARYQVALTNETLAHEEQRSEMRAAANLIGEAFFEFERGHGDDDSLSVFMQSRMPGNFYNAFERNVILLRGAMQPREGAPPTPIEDVEGQANLVRLSVARVEGCLPDGCRAGPTGIGVEAFLLLLREGFEAILILGAIVAFLRKSNRPDKLRIVYAGVAAALALTAITWVALAALFRGAERANFATRELIEGLSMLLAAGVLFYVSYWLLSKVEARRWQMFLDGKLRDSLATDRAWALGLIGFLAVYREGLETALFYQALAMRANGDLTPILGGALVASVALVGIYYAVHRLGVKIPLRQFFGITSVLLYALAIRFMGMGLFALQEADVLAATPLYSLAGALASSPLLAVLVQDIVGFSPTIEVLLGQGALLAAAAVAGGYTWWRARPEPGPAAS